MITKITDHSQQALDAMSGWTRNKPRIRKLVEILADQVQLFEDVIDDVLTNSLLENAAGVILDEYGQIFDELRGSLSDAAYQRVLQVLCAAHQSDAAAKDLIRLATILIHKAVRYYCVPPAHYHLTYITSSPISGDWETTVQRVLEILRPAGVTTALVEGEDPDVFRLGIRGLNSGKLARRVF